MRVYLLIADSPEIGKMDVEFYYVTKSNPSILITPIIVRFQL